MTTASNRIDKLLPSNEDFICLCIAIEERFLTVCDRYRRKWGVDVPIDDGVRGDMYLWRTALLRHRKGDYRHTRSELQATRSFAQWTLDENCKLCSRPFVKLEWND